MRTVIDARSLLSIVCLAWLAAACAVPPVDEVETTNQLSMGWRLAAASEDLEPRTVSTVDFDSSTWTETTVPRTVMAALVDNGEYPDPYFGRKLEAIPTERFATPWWYRTEFELDRAPEPGARLVFEGINYSADVWLNGRKVADRSQVQGAFRVFELEVAEHLVEGTNALAVLVHPPQPGDPTIGFVDWNPTSPDKNMGLWRPVQLRLPQGVSLDRVFVRSSVNLETLSEAFVTVSGTLRNHEDDGVEAVVRAAIDGAVEMEKTEVVPSGGEREIAYSLAIEDPRLWWPNGMGEPSLYDLELTVSVDGELVDTQRVAFGIREVEDYMTEEGYRGYKVNGQKVLIRGGGWVDDMMLADSRQKIEDQLRYVQHMNLNTIRLEGFWGSSHALYDIADRLGILVMVGWSCQWEWEDYLGQPVDGFGGIDTPEEMALVARSLRDQVVWLRNHPSVLVWVLASDMLPRPELEEKYYAELAEVDPSRPALVSCATGVSEVSGPSGVKMNGPYDWVSPNYWYLDRERGGAYGFNTETGPGPQPPPIESIRRMMPEENWWPIDDMWNFHSGRHNFNTIDRYKAALDARYGMTDNLEDFARIAQVANYEAMRAMFEAFSIRRPKTTGIIQWMLNSAWPELYWQLYDHYLVPSGAFYGARDASRPVNVAFDYADRGIVVVNDTREELDGATIRIRAYDLDSRLIYDDEHTLDVPAETILRLTELPELSTAGKAYLVDARISSSGGDELAKSLYWLSTKPDVLDWDISEWFVTPMASYADLTGLRRMPTVEIDVEHRFRTTENGRDLSVTLSNPSERIAFFIELAVVGAESGRRAAPVLWSDNYVTLMPGETRKVEAAIPAHALHDEAPRFRYRGVNVPGT